MDDLLSLSVQVHQIVNTYDCTTIVNNYDCKTIKDPLKKICHILMIKVIKN